jgi:hypothetical protein
VRCVRSGQTNSIFQIDVVPTDGTRLPLIEAAISVCRGFRGSLKQAKCLIARDYTASGPMPMSALIKSGKAQFKPKMSAICPITTEKRARRMRAGQLYRCSFNAIRNTLAL